MRRWTVLAGRTLVALTVTWLTAALFQNSMNRPVAAMALVLEVLVCATFGDWLFAVLASAGASMAFSWYYVDDINSFRITSLEGAFTFFMMVGTALTGSKLAVNAQRRAAEAIRRREEMERLQRLGEAAVASASLAEASRNLVDRIVESFGVAGVRLTLSGMGEPLIAGTCEGPLAGFDLPSDSLRGKLELFGGEVSDEGARALVNFIDVALDRARNAEERSRIEAARRGDELRNTVLNALAHNFKTPLTSIKAASSMLRGTDLLAPAARDLAVVIDEEADRLSELIQNSLQMAKLDARRESPQRELCSIADVVETVTSRAERYLRGRNLVIDIADGLPPVWGDPFLLEQMLTQVVDNAWKYSPPGAQIRISAARSNGTLSLSIHNEGREIPAEERERIFGKFYRGMSGRSRVEGTGLGLAIARTIVEAHGGSIRLESEPDGPAFRFLLPMNIVTARGIQ